MSLSRRALIGFAFLAPMVTMGCTPRREKTDAPRPAGRTPEMDRLVAKYAQMHEIPESLLHRVIQRESMYNPKARNGPYYGLMQIMPQTARTMGHRGSPESLLDSETNLKYAGKYLRGAWLVSDGSHDRAVKWYASGYYYEAKRRGLLRETGLKS